MNWPDWWEWEIEVSSHCRKRMVDRGFNEAELRAMLTDARQLVEQAHGSYLVSTSLDDVPWEVIVSPDQELRLIVVVTAYPCN